MSDLKRYIIQEKISAGMRLEVTGTQYNHMANVIRHRAGDLVVLLNGDGFDYTAKIISIDKKSIVLEILSREENLRKNRLNLTVLCGIAKGDCNETQAVKCSELGVNTFLPFYSENCVIPHGSSRTERLTRIAEESSKQCKRAVPMQVLESLDFKDALEGVNSKIKLIAYENEKCTSLRSAIDGQAESAAVVIGPEGGFTEQEIQLAENLGFIPVTLGKTILKADTAAIAAVAAILCVCGEWEGEK